MKKLISSTQIRAKVKQMAGLINAHYKDKGEVLAVCILKGAAFFFTDLLQELRVPLTIDFIEVQSYGGKTVSSGEVKLAKDLSSPAEGKHILIVEDIIDTGATLKYLTGLMQTRGAASVKIAAFLDKPSRRTAHINADFTGFEIPDSFVVGYGLDYAEKYRNLKHIFVADV